MEAYRRALMNAETACRNAPTEGALANTLGAAYYRTGRYNEALAALTRSAELKTRRPGDPTPRDLAFVAMTQLRLGKAEKARATADRLLTVMADPRWQSDAESIALLSETAGLLGVSGPEWKTRPIEDGEHRESGSGGISPESLTPERKDRNLLRDALFESTESPWQRRSWREDEVAGAKPYVPRAARGDERPPHHESEVADDLSLGQIVPIQPGRRYVFSGWCKTENVLVMEKPGNVGASLSILGGYERSPSLVGTNGWTFLSMVFDARERTNVTVAVRLGHHYSTATGRAWFDDLCLIELERGRP